MKYIHKVKFRLNKSGHLFRNAPYLLKHRSKNGCGVTVLRRVLAVNPAQLLQARQLQRVQIRGVVLRQMSVSLQLQEGRHRNLS